MGRRLKKKVENLSYLAKTQLSLSSKNEKKALSSYD
jgi:hypothetical protein